MRTSSWIVTPLILCYSHKLKPEGCKPAALHIKGNMKLLPILLQAESITGGLLKSLTDQALSLGILAFIATVLWKKYQKLEEKLDKYQEEDRKEMREVLESNTRCLERNTSVMERLEDVLKKN